MPLRRYGVLKVRAIGRRLGTGRNPHYQVHLVDEETDYRIAINIRSKLHPSDLFYLVNDDFRHPITTRLLDLPRGFTTLPSAPGGLALDYIRGNLFAREQMRILPASAPGDDNDLNEKLDRLILRVMADEEALAYAFGERWGPEAKKDDYFGFRPGNGIHDIHMNQGNAGEFIRDDGVWQDGGLILHFPSNGQWAAIFLKFQSQAWHTDDTTGHRIDTVGGTGTGGQPTQPATGGAAPAGGGQPAEPDRIVRIVAALVNPTGPAPETETVTLLNTSPRAVDLTGWAIADRLKNRMSLAGSLAPGATRAIQVAPPVQLGNNGGIITLLDANDLKVHGVAYTAQQAGREGWTIVF